MDLDVLTKDLRVMDATAISLAKENSIPIIVFSVKEKNNFGRVVRGEGEYSIVTDKDI